MKTFKCYYCWTSLKYGNDDDYEESPRCKKILFVESTENMIEAAIVNPRTKRDHDKLLEKSYALLLNNPQIYEGDLEIIAGRVSRRKPDLIYHSIKDINEEHPYMYEVETCDSINRSDTISQCRLFRRPAINTQGKFVLVVPETCNGDDGISIALNMLSKNHISYRYSEIIPL